MTDHTTVTHYVISYNYRPIYIAGSVAEAAEKGPGAILSKTPFDEIDGFPPYPTLARHMREIGFWTDTVMFENDTRYTAAIRIDRIESQRPTADAAETIKGALARLMKSNPNQ